MTERFGSRLERATPDNVRAFAAWFHEQQGAGREEGRYVLTDEPGASLEGAMKGFLDDALEQEPEQARQRLWVVLLELWYGVLEVHDEPRFERMFGDIPLPDEPDA
ncbi:MAG: hypothetical protein HYU66_18165 [Armatimonadetes bacterium]|nr:hypothetical protein [Armatimonadota bacterium]